MPKRIPRIPHTGILRRIRRIIGHNIATLVFFILFLYMVVTLIMYVFSSHIETYVVTTGPLSRNETYTGLAIRSESVVTARSGGYVYYYAREGTKINANGAVFGLSSTRSNDSEAKLSQESLSQIREQMLSFSKRFNSSKFNTTYSFKYELEGNILQYAGVTGNSSTPDPLTLDALEQQGDTVTNGSASQVTYGDQTISKAATDGIVLYSMDGYENITIENITAADFDQKSYHETDLKTKERVNAGDEIYTIITDERWSLLIPLTDKQAAKLQDKTSIRVKFLKDDQSQSGDFSILVIDGLKYGKIDFNKGLIRYASDRFLDIELVTNTVSGLKIPLSAVVTKEFYAIPSQFATTSDSGAITFLVSSRSGSSQETKVITPRIYATIEVQNTGVLDENLNQVSSYLYYVDKTLLKEGDAIVTEDGLSKHIVGDTGTLEGVYSINQGYAVFRRIEILDQNEEYAIIKKSTTYGLTRYDHIVRNAKNIKEQDILYN